jgi:hypothetical protein
MPRAYMPLKSVAHPPLISFSNGVRIVTRTDFMPPPLRGWEQVFRPDELKEIRDWHLAIACDCGASPVAPTTPSPESHLADARLGLQVAAPMGTFLSVCIREQDASENPLLMTTQLEQFYGTVWSRMRGFNGMTPQQIESIVNGVIFFLQSGDPRLANPIRLLEQGLVSRNNYLRVLLWVTAIDGILMAIKEQLFVQRLSAFLGAASRVFPKDDGVYIERPLSIKEVARDLFILRSEIAHGKAIGKRFWEARGDLKVLCPINAYGDSPRYVTVLEEAALSLLSQILRKIILDNLSADFANVKTWKAKLSTSP